MTYMQPWPRLSETPRAIHLKELVERLRNLEKDSFFDQNLEDSEAYNQIR